MADPNAQPPGIQPLPSLPVMGGIRPMPSGLAPIKPVANLPVMGDGGRMPQNVEAPAFSLPMPPYRPFDVMQEYNKRKFAGAAPSPTLFNR